MEVMQEQYKDTKIGRIPTDWEVVRLDEIIDFTNGKGHEKFIDENGDYIVVNSKFISQNGNVRKYSNELFSPLEKDDIAMVMSDIPNGRALAKCFLIDVNNKYTLNQRICGLRVKDLNESFPKFYYYAINRNRGYLKHNDGVGQTNLRRSEVLECLLQFPPLPEQQKIAEILTTVDEQISTTQAIIDKSKELKKGLMQKLFSEGIGHSEFKETKIGRIPKDWDVSFLRDVVDVLDSKRKPLNGEQRREMQGDIPYYGANGQVDSINQFIFDEPLILMAEDGGNFHDYSNRSIAYLVEDKCWVNNHAHVLKVKPNNDHHYIFYGLEHKNILRFINGSTRTKLNQGDLKLIPMALPPLPEQQKIAEILSETDAKIEKEEQEKAQLEELKKGLMQQLLTGQKRVKV